MIEPLGSRLWKYDDDAGRDDDIDDVTVITESNDCWLRRCAVTVQQRCAGSVEVHKLQRSTQPIGMEYRQRLSLTPCVLRWKLVVVLRLRYRRDLWLHVLRATKRRFCQVVINGEQSRVRQPVGLCQHRRLMRSLLEARMVFHRSRINRVKTPGSTINNDSFAGAKIKSRKTLIARRRIQ